MSAVANGGIADDGLMQRFQLLVWPNHDLEFHDVDRRPHEGARDTALQVFRRLDRLEATDVLERARDVPCLRFDPEAQQAFSSWRVEFERRLRSEERHSAVEAHLAKYRSLVPTLALISHLIDHGPGPVGCEAMERAQAWCSYLESHACRVYDSLVRSGLEGARTLGQRVLKGALQSPFGLRDVYRAQWSGLTTREAAAEAVDVLLDLDWLAPADLPPGQPGRPRSLYQINPRLAERAP